MRKPSTTAVRGKGKLQDRQLTIGLDLGDRSSFYCVLNGTGEAILEERVATNPEAMKKTFGEDGAEPNRAGDRYAFAMGKPASFRTGARGDRGARTQCTPDRGKQASGDRPDAQALARLARIDPRLLSPIQHRSAQAQAHLAGDPGAICVSASKNRRWSVQRED